MMSWDALEAERRRLGAVAVVQAEDLRRGDLVLVEGQRATVEDIQGYPAFIIQDGEEVLNPEAQFLVLHLRRGGTKLFPLEADEITFKPALTAVRKPPAVPAFNFLTVYAPFKPPLHFSPWANSRYCPTEQ